MYFAPDRNELTLYTDGDQYKTSFKTKFSGIIPFERLTELLLCYNDISQIIELLQYMPDIHTLKISYDVSENSRLESTDRDIFQLLFKTNNVKKLIILSECTSGDADFFLDLFPRLEYLVMERPIDIYDFGNISRCMSYGNLFLLGIRAVYFTKVARMKDAFMEEYKVDKCVSWVPKLARRRALHVDFYLWC